MYHCFGCVLGSLPCFIRGARLHYPAPTFNPTESLKGIDEESCNIWFGTPTMYVDMLSQAEQKGQVKGSLESILYSSASVLIFNLHT